MLDISCSKYIYELSSKAPVPGGGGTSAYVAALGVALGSMVGNLTLGKKKYEDVQDDILDLLKRSEDLITYLKKLVEKDADAFLPLSEIYRMPENTQVDKQVKDEALQRALIVAAKVPLEIAKCCLSAIELHKEYAKKGTRIAISDVGVGVIFCKAALQGAKLNVLINTSSMKDKELKNKIEAQLYNIEKIGLQKADKIYHDIELVLKDK